MGIVIKVENLGKKYIISHQQERYTALRDVMADTTKRAIKKVIGKGEILPKKEEFWALKNVSFEVNQGDRIGIIGRNGAGKSTLLKLLSKITEPTEGRIKIKGKIASLLEVGTGFHPELTGRENIYLNGAILGMGKVEINKKFDEIVAFSEVENFLDTPVKRYSTGMYVRLAFSVAAHLKTDILVIDEVLAVGDAQFQKKCYAKMDEIGRTGKTIFFVSHNMTSIRDLCTKGILLKSGRILNYGNIQECIDLYMNNITSSHDSEWRGEIGDENVKLLHTWVRSLDNENGLHTAASIEIGIEVDIKKRIKDLILGFRLFSEYGYEIAFVLYDDIELTPSPTIEPGKFVKEFIIPENTLAEGNYRIEFDVGIHCTKTIINTQGSLSFELKNISGIGRRFYIPQIKGRNSLFRPKWVVK